MCAPLEYWTSKWVHKWPHEWAYKFARESTHESPPERTHEGRFPCFQAFKAQNAPRRCPRKCSGNGGQVRVASSQKCYSRRASCDHAMLTRLPPPQYFRLLGTKLRPWSEKNSDRNSDRPKLCCYQGETERMVQFSVEGKLTCFGDMGE